MGEILRKLGSIRLAVVLLTVVAAVLALASVHEARQGSEAALRDFYGSRWFAVLLAGLGVNVLAAILVRWPPRRRQAGFLIAHVSILIILVGALVTRFWGVHGSLWLAREQTRSDFDTDRWVLRLSGPKEVQAVEISMGPQGPSRNVAANERGNLSLTIEQYAADTLDQGERVIADPNAPQPAIKVHLVHKEQEQTIWLMGGDPQFLGEIRIGLHRVADPKALARLLQPTTRPAEGRRGTLVVDVAGGQFKIDVGQELDKTVPLGPTGYSVRIRRYLPHAVVSGRNIKSLSSRPANPMVEFEVVAPDGKVSRHRLFARFPERDFAAMPTSGPMSGEDSTNSPVKLRYADATISDAQADRIDLLLDGHNEVHVRSTDSEGVVTAVPASVEKAVTVPGQAIQLTILKVLPNARSERDLKPIPLRKQQAVPAAFICLRAEAATYRLWIRKGEGYAVDIGKQQYRVSFTPAVTPLGFSIKLLAPIITYYPGTRQARTYQSRVLVEDAASGSRHEQTISMNAPLHYGGYRLFQSSYQFDPQGEPSASLLSVARDPGEAIVYVGYVGLILGMLITLIQRLRRSSGEKVTAS